MAEMQNTGDPYRDGTLAQSPLPVMFLDPNLFDAETRAKLKHGDHQALEDNRDKFRESLKRLNPNIDPAMVDRMSNLQLNDMMIHAATRGPSAEIVADDHGIPQQCDVTMPVEREDNKQNILSVMELDRLYYTAHFRPIPGTYQEWAYGIGVHEGGHCGQDYIESITQELDSFRREIGADQDKVNSLRAEGKHDMVQYLIDMRILKAANGDARHTSSLFIGDGSPLPVSQEHLSAAHLFGEHMITAVALNNHMTRVESLQLMHADPQRFATLLEKTIQSGEFPGPVFMDNLQLESVIAQKMGLRTLDEANSSQLQEIRRIYEEMERNGELAVPNGENAQTNEYILKYAKAYIDATHRMFVSDTTPDPSQPLPEALKPLFSSSPDAPSTPVQAPSDAELRAQASNQAELAIFLAVSKHLGGDNKVFALQNRGMDEYLKLAKQLLDEGNIPPTTDSGAMTQDQKDTLIADSLGIKKDSLETLKQNNPFLFELASRKLRQEDAFTVKHENPYLYDAIRQKIEEMTPGGMSKSYSQINGEQNLYGISASSVNFSSEGNLTIAGKPPSEYFNATASVLDVKLPSPQTDYVTAFNPAVAKV
ncbi:MAG: hypothetical protein KDI13_09565 [Alphaproteobacteria bacterium]|nr:hypothetical protein [Alphaproteobacteria bacterium]